MSPGINELTIESLKTGEVLRHEFSQREPQPDVVEARWGQTG